ncbi:MAG: hypothetical protein WD426_12245 [Anditalea sp.]
MAGILVYGGRLALANLIAYRSTLIIAHRMNTIPRADEILVIQNGEIVQRGTSNEVN